MTRRAIHLPGSYGLEAEIERRMQPESVKPRGLAMQALWGWLTVLTGIGMVLGILFGLVFILPVAAVFRRGKR
ncbi:MAG TPA: hypothetical protein VFU31_29810 [Candidatus Binatia bacterium]|nr:hypothetical protein [Candidatus Binatia bacterium]